MVLVLCTPTQLFGVLLMHLVPGSISLLIMSVIIPCGLLVYISVDVFRTLVPALLVTGVTFAGLGYAYWKRFTNAQFKLLRSNES